MDQLDERLRDDAEYYSSDAYDHVNYPLPYTFCVPSENDIDAETALFIAYDYLMQDKNFSYDRLLHFYPRFLFVSTETTGTLWWVQFYCFDMTYSDTYRVLIYAPDPKHHGRMNGRRCERKTGGASFEAPPDGSITLALQPFSHKQRVLI